MFESPLPPVTDWQSHGICFSYMSRYCSFHFLVLPRSTVHARVSFVGGYASLFCFMFWVVVNSSLSLSFNPFTS